jgi:type I restriction enzyme S subunit
MTKWTSVPLRAVLEQRRESVSVHTDALYPLLGVRWYGGGAFIRETVDAATTSATQFQPARPGDLIYNRLFAWKQSFALLNNDHAGCFASNEFPMFKVTDEADAKYLVYSLLRDEVSQIIDSESTGATSISRNRWSEESLRKLEVPLPPIDAQRRIADFLDDQVPRIDGVVSLRTREGDALVQRHAELSRQLTTAGLPGGELEPSGISWMPTVRSSWPILRIAALFETGSGTTPKSDHAEYFDGEIPWVNTGDLRDGITFASKSVTHQALADYSTLRRYPVGSLVIAMYGATTGRVGLLGESSCVNQACCVLSSKGQMLPHFAFYWLLGHRAEIVQLATGAGQPNISQEAVRSLHMPLPSLEEQRAALSVSLV